MNIKHPVIAAGMLALPMLAYAQAPAVNEQSSTWSNLFWGILPFIILLAIFIPLIRRQRPIIKRAQDHMVRQVQHMERVEQSLDRIIKLLEQKD